MIYLYRYITYQTSTKIYDYRFSIEIDETNVDYILGLFQSYFASIKKANLNYPLFLETQYLILWQYTLSDKILNPNSKPYIWVTHRDNNGVSNPNTIPRYFKCKIELEHYIQYMRDQARLELTVLTLYRNCLKKVG